jgi:hypothetical protein
MQWPVLKSSTKFRCVPLRDDRGKMMDQQTDIDVNQTDEDILTYTVSDEALEAAASTERGVALTYNIRVTLCADCA